MENDMFLVLNASFIKSPHQAEDKTRFQNSDFFQPFLLGGATTSSIFFVVVSWM